MLPPFINPIPEVSIRAEIHDNKPIVSLRERLVQGDSTIATADLPLKIDYPALTSEVMLVNVGP
jgi:hypothetical protein